MTSPDPAALADRLDKLSWFRRSDGANEVMREAAALIRVIPAKDAELAKLRTNRVDLLTEHGLEPNTPIEDVLSYHEHCCRWKPEVVTLTGIANRGADGWVPSNNGTDWCRGDPAFELIFIEPMTDQEKAWFAARGKSE